MKHIRLTAVLFLIMIGLVISPTSGVWCAEKISHPFEYSGYSSPEYNSYVRSSEYVSMYGGTKLAVDYYLPSEGPTDGPFPVLFCYYPYLRATANPETGEVTVQFSPDHETVIKTFTSHGYAVVITDMRGSGASYGSKGVDMSPQFAMDGKQLIDWLEEQTWCNGNVGMYGGSYFGWSQFAVAGQKPRALKAIMPEVIAFDMFAGGLFYVGGIYNKWMIETWGATVSLFDQAAYIPDVLYPAAPVVDEDGDGSLADEIPLDQNGNFLFIDDGYPPIYSDGGERTEHIYYNAILEHLDNIAPTQWAPNAFYRDADIAGLGYTYSDLGPSDWPVHIKESGIPIYNIGGWFDLFTLGTTRWYASMKATNPSKMLIHPSFHGVPDISPGFGPYWDYFGEDTEQAASRFTQEKLRFFDKYLKGIENGIDKEPPVYIFVMNGEGWRSENEWPLARQEITNYYFEGGSALSTVRETEGSDDYQIDLTHSSTYGSTGTGTRWVTRRRPDEVMKRTDKDLQCLTYTSETLEQDTEVTGHPIIHLWVSSTADYGDFFVYLEDVDEEGESNYVTEGILRAGFAGIVPEEDLLPPDAGIDVKPDLSYHGFKQTDYVDVIFAGGNMVELVIDLYPTSWVFKKGHRIRVSIACADWPTFDLHPKLSPTNDPNDPANIIPTITVYRDANHPSHIELPVIPSKVSEGAADDDDICFIATAAYGSPLESHVEMLRQFRDVYLMPSRIGHAFVDAYYRYSPPVANFIAKRESLQGMVRLSLLPLVGVSWVALNLGPVPTLAFMALLLTLIIATTIVLFRKIRL